MKRTSNLAILCPSYKCFKKRPFSHARKRRLVILETCQQRQNDVIILTTFYRHCALADRVHAAVVGLQHLKTSRKLNTFYHTIPAFITTIKNKPLQFFEHWNWHERHLLVYEKCTWYIARCRHDCSVCIRTETVTFSGFKFKIRQKNEILFLITKI